MVQKSFFILRNVPFHTAKGYLWACKRIPFTIKLMAFCISNICFYKNHAIKKSPQLLTTEEPRGYYLKLCLSV